MGRRADQPVLFAGSAVRMDRFNGGCTLASGRLENGRAGSRQSVEYTTYRIADGSLAMSDRMGRSFTASLNGAAAPYVGDSRFTSVSVRWIDERTIEESDLNGGLLVQVTRWQVDPDGSTMHVRFDDTRGNVMEQTGHKLAVNHACRPSYAVTRSGPHLRVGPPAPLPLTSRDDPRPQRLHAPPRPLGVQPPRRARADHGPRRFGRRAGLRQPRPDRPRRALRRRRLLPGLRDEGHQADHRRRDLRRPPVDDREGGQGRRPALPPDPAGEGRRRLPQPLPARHRRPRRRLLLQAPDRSRAPRPALARASSACRACLGGEIPRALEIDDWDEARRLAGEYRDILGKGNFFLELQDHGLPEQRVAEREAAAPRAGDRPPARRRRTTSTTSTSPRPTPTTSCSASAPATTSTRRAG